MKPTFKAKCCIFVVILSCCIALSACAGGASSNLTEEQIANRNYMSQVNEIMVGLDEGLDSFVDAVSRGDIVNMKTQADAAFKSLDKLSGLEAPEALSDVQASYVDGCNKLKDALNQYIDLYSGAAKSQDSFDWASYEKKIADIQALYDSGVEALEKGDKAAAEA